MLFPQSISPVEKDEGTLSVPMQTTRKFRALLLSHSRVTFPTFRDFGQLDEKQRESALLPSHQKLRNARAVARATARFQRVDEPFGTTFGYD